MFPARPWRCRARGTAVPTCVLAMVVVAAAVVVDLADGTPAAAAVPAVAAGAPRRVGARTPIADPTRPFAAVRRAPAYVPPVDAPIVDHFRPPACSWCAGNRGIDYAVDPGTSVAASAAGSVTFAGRVGFDLFVVVAHADGLRTTYAFLASVGVSVGQRVAQGDPVGTSGDRLHFGVRRGDTYLDPELLFSGLVVRARLVPTDGSPPRRS